MRTLEQLTNEEAHNLFRKSALIEDGVIFYEGESRFLKDNSDLVHEVISDDSCASLELEWRYKNNLINLLIHAYQGLTRQIQLDSRISLIQSDFEVAVILPEFDEFVNCCKYLVQGFDGQKKEKKFYEIDENDCLAMNISAVLNYNLAILDRRELNKKLGKLSSQIQRKRENDINVLLKKYFPNAIAIEQGVPIYDSYDKIRIDDQKIILTEESVEQLLSPRICHVKSFRNFNDGKTKNSCLLIDDADLMGSQLYGVGLKIIVSEVKKNNHKNPFFILVKPEEECKSFHELSCQYVDGRTLISGNSSQVLDIPLRSFSYALRIPYQVIYTD